MVTSRKDYRKMDTSRKDCRKMDTSRNNYRKMDTSRTECRKVQEASNLLKQQMKIFLLVVVVKVTAHYLYELIMN